MTARRLLLPTLIHHFELDQLSGTVHSEGCSEAYASHLSMIEQPFVSNLASASNPLRLMAIQPVQQQMALIPYTGSLASMYSYEDIWKRVSFRQQGRAGVRNGQFQPEGQVSFALLATMQCVVVGRTALIICSPSNPFNLRTSCLPAVGCCRQQT